MIHLRKSEAKSRIYRQLKKGPKTIDELQVSLGRVRKKEISAYLDQMIKERWVIRQAGCYLLRYELYTPFDPDDRCKEQFWDYERIQEVQVRPETWTNPFLPIITSLDWHKDVPKYGWKGHSWGAAGRCLVWLKQLELADPLPPDDKLKSFLYDVPIELNQWVGNYAGIKSFDGIKDAVYNYGCAILNLNLYENLYQDFGVGRLPDPVGRSIGSRIMCVVGYDQDNLIVLNPIWGKVNTVSWRYYMTAGGNAFTVLDQFDADRAKDMYGTLRITSSVPCEIWVNRDLYVCDGMSAAAEFGKEYKVTAIPLEDKYVEEKFQCHDITVTRDKPEVKCNFVFTPIERTKLEEYLDRLKQIFK